MLWRTLRRRRGFDGSDTMHCLTLISHTPWESPGTNPVGSAVHEALHREAEWARQAAILTSFPSAANRTIASSEPRKLTLHLAAAVRLLVKDVNSVVGRRLVQSVGALDVEHSVKPFPDFQWQGGEL